MRIVDGRTIGCWFNGRRRSLPPESVVWHWTGGLQAAPGVYRTLAHRGLSVHYVIDPDGRIVQMADDARATFHAGTYNQYSIGVEVVSPGNLFLDANLAGRKIVQCPDIPQRAWSFTERQEDSIRFLADHLSATNGIPRAVPSRPDRINSVFRGHVEHRHVSPHKIDAGGLVMALLRSSFQISPATTADGLDDKGNA